LIQSLDCFKVSFLHLVKNSGHVGFSSDDTGNLDVLPKEIEESFV